MNTPGMLLHAGRVRLSVYIRRLYIKRKIGTKPPIRIGTLHQFGHDAKPSSPLSQDLRHMVPIDAANGIDRDLYRLADLLEERKAPGRDPFFAAGGEDVSSDQIRSSHCLGLQSVFHTVDGCPYLRKSV